MNKSLKYAGVGGILSLILGVLLPIVEYLKIKQLPNFGSFFVSLYIFALVTSLILYIIFIYGFILIAKRYQNNLLKISSYLLIISAIILQGYLVFISILPALENKIINILIHILALVIFGGGSIPFGIALLTLKSYFGSLAIAAGVIKIIMGPSVVSIVLLPLGFLLFIPFYILGSMILFRAAQKIERISLR